MVGFLLDIIERSGPKAFFPSHSESLISGSDHLAASAWRPTPFSAPGIAAVARDQLIFVSQLGFLTRNAESCAGLDIGAHGTLRFSEAASDPPDFCHWSRLRTVQYLPPLPGKPKPCPCSLLRLGKAL